MGPSIERRDFVHHIVERLMCHLRSRQSGKLRKFIDHMLETRHFVDDHVGRLVKDRLEIRGLLEKLLPQTLGGQLDGRQRVLNLVRHPPRHLLPRRHFLSLDQLREIFEHQHNSEVLTRFILHTRPMKPDGQESAVDLHRTFESQRIALIGQHPIIDCLEQIESKLFEHLIGRSATKSIRRKPKDPFTGRIEIRDQPVLIDGE